MTGMTATKVLLASLRNREGRFRRPGVEKVREALTLSGHEVIVSGDDSYLDECQYVVATNPLALAKVADRKDDLGRKAVVFALCDPPTVSRPGKKTGRPELKHAKAYKDASLAIVQSPAARAFMAAALPELKIETCLLALPHDMRKETPAIEKDAVLRACGFEASKPLYLLTGTFLSEKQMEAAEGLARIMPDSQFLLFGTYVRLEGKARKAVHRAKLPNISYLEEMRPELYRSALATAKALLILDPWTGEPFTAMDAIWSGIPVIAPHLNLLAGLFTPGLDYLESKPSTLGFFEAVKSLATVAGSQLVATARERLGILKERQDWKRLGALLGDL